MEPQILVRADNFWNVKAQEAQQEEALRLKIEELRRATELGHRAGLIRTSPGYPAFLQAVQSLRDIAVRKLVTETKFTNDGMREQRGRVLALEDVLILLTREHVVDQLEAKRQTLEQELAQALERRPTKREEP